MKRFNLILMILALAVQVSGLTGYTVWKAQAGRPQTGWHCGLKLCLCKDHRHSHHHGYAAHGEQTSVRILPNGSKEVLEISDSQMPGHGAVTDMMLLTFLTSAENTLFEFSSQAFYPLSTPFHSLEPDGRLGKPPEFSLLF